MNAEKEVKLEIGTTEDETGIWIELSNADGSATRYMTPEEAAMLAANLSSLAQIARGNLKALQTEN